MSYPLLGVIGSTGQSEGDGGGGLSIRGTVVGTLKPTKGLPRAQRIPFPSNKENRQAGGGFHFQDLGISFGVSAYLGEDVRAHPAQP